MMERTTNLKLLVIALALVAVTFAHAQNAQPASAALPSHASMPDKKAMRAENRKLQKAVIRALSRAKGLKATNISVIARQGEVTLRGSVVDAMQSELAATVTSSVNGVTAVKNDLVIRPE